jgi:hypothetical protein
MPYIIKTAAAEILPRTYRERAAAVKALTRRAEIGAQVWWCKYGRHPKLLVATFDPAGVTHLDVQPNAARAPGSLEYEFPDYPVETLPQDIPAWMVPTHWHNDTAPSWTFRGPDGAMVIYIDYADVSQREMHSDGSRRFTLMTFDANDRHMGDFATDDWAEAKGTLIAMRWTHACRIGIDAHGIYARSVGDKPVAIAEGIEAEFNADLDAMMACGDAGQYAMNALAAMALIPEKERLIQPPQPVEAEVAEATPDDFLACLTGLSDDPLRRAAQIALAAIDLTISVGDGTPALTAAHQALVAVLGNECGGSEA